MPDFLPRREADLLAWSLNFDQRVNADPGALGLSPQQAADFRAAYDAFAEAYHLARQPGTRTPVAMVGKDASKAALIGRARELAALVRAAAGVSNTQRVELGLGARDPGRVTRIAPPTAAPRLSVQPILGRSAVRVMLLDPASPTRRARPKGIAGAVLFTSVGEDMPDAASPTDGPWKWTFRGQATRMTTDLDLPAGLGFGAKVWVTAQWFNPTGQRGPASPPAATRLAGGWTLATTAAA